ncbi:MAG: alpha/beta fold hydrolase, partial [Gaiellaceae bacterium]
MSETTSEGYSLWYGTQGDGDPVVLTGGFGLVHDQFEQVTPLLANDHRVINWAWRGAGRSDRALGASPSIDAWTRDLEAVLDSAGVERAVLWGTSTGALVSLHFAARHPD